jgi:poly-gamma-glutamate capsule biosynthesis protein CapA/YwtB (metallophosphatase superfamily)
MAHLDLLFTGDLVLDEPDPDFWLADLAYALRAADAAIGHLEVPHTARGLELVGDVPAPGADPAHLDALARAGFAAVSLAGNHIADCGPEGIADTIARLDSVGVAHAGAGATLEAARSPARMQRAWRAITLLSFNCVGPENGWATPVRAGCAYVRIRTADGSPAAPNAPFTQPDPESIAEMQRDIRQARLGSDVLIVALHKGIVHRRAQLAPYERTVAQAAIDAGADIVVGHHAHIARGIEMYRGKPIFHGLGNGCVVTRALSPHQSHPARAAWARKRRELFGFEPDPAYELAPFHPEAVNAIMGKVRVDRAGSIDVGIVPVHVEAPGRPRLARSIEALRVTDYIETITAEARLPAVKFSLRDDGAWLEVQR